MNNVYIGRQDVFFREIDILFYENNPFDHIYSYLDDSLGAEEEPSLTSNSVPFLNDAAEEIFSKIDIDPKVFGDVFAYSEAIKESLAMIQFIEISKAWVYASFSASAVLRKKAQNQKKRVILYIRIFQFTVGLNMLWYTLARFISGGRIYSNIFFYLYALTAALIAGLLFYVILLFRRAVILDRLYRSKMSSTKLPNTPKRKKLEEIIRPIENAAAVLILCLSGIVVVNIYFGVNYTSRMDRLRARNENLSKSFETFNNLCLIFGMVCIFFYLCWSNKTAKELLFSKNSSKGIHTKEGGGTSYFIKTGDNESSSQGFSTQKNIMSVVSMPQVAGQYFHDDFGISTHIEISSMNQTNLDTTASMFDTSIPGSSAPSKTTKTITSEVQISN
eukprot:snap_masked-scaffold_2-processed-gene-16.24-mRNA-1 protein AED:1.00 eAED:1.00 QI:0/0/0/0/1/1/3/0/388